MNLQRFAFGLSLALAGGLILPTGGCANGGDDDSTGDDGDEGGGPAGDATSDHHVEASSSGGDAPACTSPTTRCGSTCTNTSSDPKNCGACNTVCTSYQSCTAGQCVDGCPTGETLCGGPTDAGGSSSGSDAASEAGKAPDAMAGEDASGQPYCANLTTDNDNCGVCGYACTGDNACKSGLCTLSCPAGQTACVAGDVCISPSTCCSSKDCTVTGEVCPQPGGTCACPGGETLCAATNSCIASSDCCTDADCSAVTGASCPTPGQPCQCMTSGDKACPATKSCVPQSTCCTAAGACCDDALGKSCGAASAQAALTLGGTISVTGVLTATGEENWVEVVFNSESSGDFHGHIKFTANPSNEFVFDLASNCSGALRACGEGGTCKGKTEWEDFYTPPANATNPIPAIGATYIRVYRANAAAAPTCDAWVLSISE